MSSLVSNGNSDVKSEEKDENEANLWLNMLNEVQESSTHKLPSYKTVLVLGDNESGKTSLIAKLSSSMIDEDLHKGSGLEYHCLYVNNDYLDDHSRLNVFIMDGDVWGYHRSLMKFALNEETFPHTTVLLTASMSKPSAIMESLQNWAQILEEHIERLRIPKEVMVEYRKRVLKRFEDYVEPGAEIDGVTSPIRPANTLDGTSPDRDDIEKNLGLEIVVVITKTDYMTTLEKDFDMKEEHFDFIQLSIRNFCLEYGASLFYVSVKEDKNCSLLFKYLIHRIYNFPFKTSALVVEKDGVFIPAGWDTKKKISILNDNLTTVRPTDSFNDVIVKPVTRKPLQHEAEVSAEEDIVFLVKLQNLLNQQTPPTIGRPVTTQETAIRTPPGVQKTADRRLSGSPGVQASPKKIEGKHGTVGGEGVLQNFFNSLLNRRTGTAPIGGSPSVRSLGDKSTARLDAAVELDRMSGSKKGSFNKSSDSSFVDEESEESSQTTSKSLQS